MKSLFEMGFRNSFAPMMGQDEANPWGEGSGGPPVTYDQLTPSSPSDSTWGAGGPPVTSLPSQTPGTAVPPTKPPGTSDSDWAKIIAQGITAGGAGYGAYSKEQVAKITAQTQKNAPKPSGAPVMAPSGSSSNTIFLVGGLAVVGLIAAVALR